MQSSQGGRKSTVDIDIFTDEMTQNSKALTFIE